MRPSSCAPASCLTNDQTFKAVGSSSQLVTAMSSNWQASRQVCDQQAAVLHHLNRSAGLLKVFFLVSEVYGRWLMRMRRSNLLLSQKDLILRYTIVYKAFCCLCLPAT